MKHPHNHTYIATSEILFRKNVSFGMRVMTVDFKLIFIDHTHSPHFQIFGTISIFVYLYLTKAEKNKQTNTIFN